MNQWNFHEKKKKLKLFRGWSKKKTGLEKVSWPAYPNIHPIFNKFRVFIIHNSILIIIKNKKIDWWQFFNLNKNINSPKFLTFFFNSNIRYYAIIPHENAAMTPKIRGTIWENRRVHSISKWIIGSICSFFSF